MPLKKLDHYSIRTLKLEESKDFYVDVLGMTVGDRPDFDFPGYWLYVDGLPVVHLVGIDPDNPQGLIDYLGEVDVDDLDSSGTLDHVAFVASDPKAFKEHLEQKSMPYRERDVPGMNLYQIFVDDPNKISVEVNYFN